MKRPVQFLLLASAAAALASCAGPEPRPFAGRGGRSLDAPPRYGDTAREPAPTSYSEGVPGGDIDPQGIPAPSLDSGLVVTPPAPAPSPAPGEQAPVVPGGVTTPPAVTTTPAPAPAAPAPATEVPFARPVPGKPGFVYSLRDPKKIISVDGLRPGQKARDPETGDIFRVPY